MKLGFVSAILPDLSLEDVLSRAEKIGYECVEVMCWPVGKAERRYAGVTHLDVTNFGEQDAERTRELCERYGASIEYRLRPQDQANRNEFRVVLRRQALANTDPRLPLAS